MGSPVTLPPIALPSVPPPTQLAAAVAAAPSSPPVIALDGSLQALAALATLAGAASFTGTIAPSDSEGSVALLTAFGAFSITDPPALPIGAQLTLQVAADNPAAVAILAIDDVPTAQPVSPAQGAAPPAPNEAPPAIVDLGSLVRATVIAAAAPAAVENILVSEIEAAAAPASLPGPVIVTPGAVPASEQPPAMPSAATPSPPDASQNAPVTSPPGAPLAPLAAAPSGTPAASLPPADRSGEAAPILIEVSVPAVVPATQQTLAGGAAPPPSQASVLASATITQAPGESAAVSDAATPPPDVRALPAGTSLALRIIAVQQAPAPGETDESTPPALTGIVRIAEPAGPIVVTPAGVLQLAPAPALAPGARIALHLLAGDPATARLTLLAKAPPETGRAPLPASGGSPAGQSPPPASEPAPPAATSQLLSAALPTRPATELRASDAAAPLDTLITRIFFVDAPAANAGKAATPAVIGTILADQTAAPATASLVDTPIGILAVTPRLALPAGALLLLQALDTPLVADPALTARPPNLAKSWPALRAAIGALSRAAPELGHRFLSDLSIEGGEKLAAALLFLVATLGKEGPSAWPGEAFERALALAGRDDLKQRLGEDVVELRRIAADPATGHWQVFLLPVYDGTTLRPVRLYLARRDERRNRGGGDEDTARFVLEFELTRIGALQLDGFIRRRRFDLALRSHAPLTPSMRVEIARIFRDRIAAAGLTGEIDFATVSRFDIAPLDALQARVGMAV